MSPPFTPAFLSRAFAESTFADAEISSSDAPERKDFFDEGLFSNTPSEISPAAGFANTRISAILLLSRARESAFLTSALSNGAVFVLNMKESTDMDPETDALLL